VDIPAAVERMRRDMLGSLWKTGTVSGSQSSPARVIVTVQNGSMTLPRLASYTPTTGDTVLIAATSIGWIVLGKIA
jgi:hypothetical protein